MTARAIVAFFLITAASFAAEPARKNNLFEIRRVFEQPSADTVEMEISRGALQEILYVARKPVLTETAIQSASVSRDPFSSSPQIEIIFNKSAQKTFAELTRTNIGQRIAILLNGRVQNAPVIRQQIPGGRILISGDFNEDRAKQIADEINRAARPASGS